VADFETEDGESVAALNSYTHDGEWVWMLNSTSPLASAEFVDRKGSALEPTFNPSAFFFALHLFSLNHKALGENQSKVFLNMYVCSC